VRNASGALLAKAAILLDSFQGILAQARLKAML
jgi:hypothetical protein